MGNSPAFRRGGGGGGGGARGGYGYGNGYARKGRTSANDRRGSPSDRSGGERVETSTQATARLAAGGEHRRRRKRRRRPAKAAERRKTTAEGEGMPRAREAARKVDERSNGSTCRPGVRARVVYEDSNALSRRDASIAFGAIPMQASCPPRAASHLLRGIRSTRGKGSSDCSHRWPPSGSPKPRSLALQDLQPRCVATCLRLCFRMLTR